MYFGRHEEGPLESEFAGNLVEVCPTGVFTDKALVHEYTRKWDLQSAPSVCVACAVGCNTMPGERYGKLKRIHNRFNAEVNGYFLCDRGRFGGGFVNDAKRLDHAARRGGDGRFTALDAEAALAEIEPRLARGALAGIGSPRASVEANYALQRLVGAENFCPGQADAEAASLRAILGHLLRSGARNPSLADIEKADAVLILGEDPTHIAPRAALALRQSVRNEALRMAAELELQPWQDDAIRNLAQQRRSPLHIIAPYRTALADVAASSQCLPPGDCRRAGEALLAALDGAAGKPEAARIAADLLAAERPLLLAGTTGGLGLIDAAAALAGRLRQLGKAAMLGYCMPEANSLGVTLLTAERGAGLSELAERAGRGGIDTLLVMENDLFRRADSGLVRELFGNVGCAIGLDCVEQETLALCDWVLPAAAFTEAEGTLVSSEGRAQRFFPVHPPAEQRRAAWQWLQRLRGGSERFDELNRECAAQCPALAGIRDCAPGREYRERGLKVPRQPPRYSGRTAMRADVSVHEPRRAEDQDSPLAYTMEGGSGARHGALLPYVWAPGWNSNQSLHKFQGEAGGPLRGGGCGTRLLDSLALRIRETGEAAPEEAGSEFALWPRHQAFGSDELSMRCARIAELAGPGRVYLNPADAERLGVAAGDGVSARGCALEVFLDDTLPRRCAAYSAGHPDCAELASAASAELARAPGWVRREPRLLASDRGGGGHVR